MKFHLRDPKSTKTSKMIYESPGLLLATRVVGLGFALIVAFTEILVALQFIHILPLWKWVVWPTAVLFLAIGLIQFFWLPVNRQKVIVWLYSFLVLGFIVSVTIFGFTSLIYLGWLVLVLVMGIYVSESFAILGYSVMLIALAIRLSLYPKAIVTDILSVLALGFAILIIMAIWRASSINFKKLDHGNHELNLERERLSTLINNMSDGVIALDSYGKIRLYNASALSVLDTNEQISGKPIVDYLKPFDKFNKPFNINHYLKSLDKADILDNLRLKYLDGSVINLYLSVSPIRLGYGAGTSGFTMILRDITREKSLDEERDEFISVVSHELRTPIAIAEGNISNAQFVLNNARSNNRPDLVKRSIEDAHNQVLFLADMINDLSTLSRAERGKLDLKIEEIDVNKLLDELLEAYKPEADKKNLKLALKHSAKTTFVYSADLYVREIMQNFITNSLKYTEKGSITISAISIPNGVELSVSDTGIGMSKADKERVFDKFFRSEDYRTRKTNGTGLGLYVTMKLARLLKAEISIESQLNSGSTFTAIFPNLAPEITQDNN